VGALEGSLGRRDSSGETHGSCPSWEKFSSEGTLGGERPGPDARGRDSPWESPGRVWDEISPVGRDSRKLSLVGEIFLGGDPRGRASQTGRPRERFPGGTRSWESPGRVAWEEISPDGTPLGRDSRKLSLVGEIFPGGDPRGISPEGEPPWDAPLRKRSPWALWTCRRRGTPLRGTRRVGLLWGTT
jgi:hypothetical protein